MNLRFRRVFRFGSIRTAINKTGLGFSIGIRGFRIGISPEKRIYISFGFPGTGLYWIKYF